MMKTIKINGLISCPVCGNSAQLIRNATKQFKVKCSACPTCTDWTQKAQAIVDWYNLHFQLQAARFFKTQPKFVAMANREDDDA